MKQYNRSNITEEPIISPVDPCGGRVCDECEIGGCDHGIESELNPDLKAQMEQNRSKVIDADRTKADHIRIQARILREARERQLSEQSQSERAAMIDTDAEQRHRFKLRDQK